MSLELTDEQKVLLVTTLANMKDEEYTEDRNTINPIEQLERYRNYSNGWNDCIDKIIERLK